MNTLLTMMVIIASLHSASGVHPFVVKDQPTLTSICQNTTDEVLKGCFYSGINYIFVRTDMSTTTFDFTVRHEVGHYLLQHKDLSVFRKEQASSTAALTKQLIGAGVPSMVVEEVNRNTIVVDEYAANEFAHWSIASSSVPRVEADIFAKL